MNNILDVLLSIRTPSIYRRHKPLPIAFHWFVKQPLEISPHMGPVLLATIDQWGWHPLHPSKLDHSCRDGDSTRLWVQKWRCALKRCSCFKFNAVNRVVRMILINIHAVMTYISCTSYHVFHGNHLFHATCSFLKHVLWNQRRQLGWIKKGYIIEVVAVAKLAGNQCLWMECCNVSDQKSCSHANSAYPVQKDPYRSKKTALTTHSADLEFTSHSLTVDFQVKLAHSRDDRLTPCESALQCFSTFDYRLFSVCWVDSCSMT